MGKLCATPFGIDVVGITEVIAITGALVGGATAPRVAAAAVGTCSCSALHHHCWSHCARLAWSGRGDKGPVAGLPCQRPLVCSNHGSAMQWRGAHRVPFGRHQRTAAQGGAGAVE